MDDTNQGTLDLEKILAGYDQSAEFRDGIQSACGAQRNELPVLFELFAHAGVVDYTDFLDRLLNLPAGVDLRHLALCADTGPDSWRKEPTKGLCISKPSLAESSSSQRWREPAQASVCPPTAVATEGDQRASVGQSAYSYSTVADETDVSTSQHTLLQLDQLSEKLDDLKTQVEAQPAAFLREISAHTFMKPLVSEFPGGNVCRPKDAKGQTADLLHDRHKYPTAADEARRVVGNAVKPTTCGLAEQQTIAHKVLSQDDPSRSGQKETASHITRGRQPPQALCRPYDEEVCVSCVVPMQCDPPYGKY